MNNNKIFYIIIGIVTLGLVYLLAPILTPFLVGALLAYLVDPLVRLLMRLKMPRLLAVIIVFFVLFAIILAVVFLLIPLIQNQLETLTEFIPATIAWMQETMLPALKERFGIQEIINITTLKATLSDNWTKAGGLASWLFSTVLHSGFALIALITNLILIPVVTFYLLRDWDMVIRRARKLIPRSIEPTVVDLVTQCDEVLSAFFRGQLLVMFLLGVIYSLGLMMIGLKVGLAIGLISGLVAIVPYLGFIVGVTSASIAAYVQFGTLSAVAWVWVVFAIGQVLESNVLTPKLVGERIGLHPVAVIFAVLAGAVLFGFFGVLLALPVAAVIMVMIRYLNQQYQNSRLYQ